MASQNQSPDSSASMRASRPSPSASHSNLATPSDHIPVDTLVTHLLASKRSLSSISHVLTAKELATSARSAHEDISILYANASFLRASIIDEAALLVRLRRSLQGSYEWGKKDFKTLVRRMDEADGELVGTMEMLRRTVVGREIWRGDEDQEGHDEAEDPKDKNLLDFVDEAAVEGMREAMKKSIEQLQTYQQSFDGDLLRFDADIRALKKFIMDAPPLDPPSQEGPEQPFPLVRETHTLLDTITDEASHMAVLLTSLTKHFDMCVTAVRTTEGAAALAKRRVKEGKENQQDVAGVSISGVIAEQEQRGEGGADDLAPESAEDRREMLRVVVQDAEEVDDVVVEIAERLAVIREAHEQLSSLLEQTQASRLTLLGAHDHLLTIATHLPDYLAAENYFLTSWSHESLLIASKLDEMYAMREFYEGYASSFSALLLEVERRSAAEEKVRSIWRKARREAEKVLEGDERERESFRADAGEYLPGDLWKGLGRGPRRWEVVEVNQEGRLGQPLER